MKSKKKGLHFRNPQTSAGSIRLVYHKVLYTSGFNVKTKKDVFTSGIHILQRVYWVILYYRVMAICIFHPLLMSAKRIQAMQKNFQATQLWVATHRLRTIDFRLLKLKLCVVLFINYIQTQTLTQPWTLLCKQTKQNCLTATTNHSNRTPQKCFQTLFFYFFCFGLQLK